MVLKYIILFIKAYIFWLKKPIPMGYGVWGGPDNYSTMVEMVRIPKHPTFEVRDLMSQSKY